MTANLPVLILPGYGDSGPDHWQSHWERKPDPTVPARGAERLARAQAWRTGWRRSSASVAECAEPPVLAAHSLACPLVAHWARRTRALRARAALLVAPGRRRLAASHPRRGAELQPDPARPASLPQHRGGQHRRSVRLDGPLEPSSRRRGAASWSRSPAPATSTPTRATAPGPKAAGCWRTSAAADAAALYRPGAQRRSTLLRGPRASTRRPRRRLVSA